MQSRPKFGNIVRAQLITNPHQLHRCLLNGLWTFEHIRGGKVIHRETVKNMIVNAGLDYLLDVALSGGSQLSTWYVGLISATPTIAAGNTMGSHAGWTEVTDYSQANRVTWSDGGVSGQSVDNTGSPAAFSINASVTVGGAFLTSNNTKGGTTGTLFSATAFASGNRSFINGDTLNVTATYSAADDGV